MAFASYRARALLRRALPDTLVRRIRVRRMRAAERARAARQRQAIETHGTFSPDDLFLALRAAGIREGGVLLVQSSFGDLLNFSGTPQSVVDVLERLVGPAGTLLMPAHTHYNDDGPFRFDVRRSPAHTGIICELFRRQPGVLRSLHPTHSVCAKGPLAAVLTADHHRDELSCGPRSPYARLREHRGEILGLGLPPGYTTFLHVVEDVDLARFPRRTYLDRAVDFTVVDAGGVSAVVPARRRDPVLGSTLDLARVTPRLSDAAHRAFHVAGVPMFLANAEVLFREMIALRDRGITLYE